MEASIATLADYALITPDGKLTILGAFSAVRAFRFPCTHPHATFACVIQFTQPEANRTYHGRAEFRDQDGKAIGEPVPLDVTAPPAVEGISTANILLNIQGFGFPAAGLYTVSLWLENREVARCRVQAMQLEQP